MIRALVPVAIVAIVAATVLVVHLTTKRREVRRAELQGLKTQNRLLVDLLHRIEQETRVQIAAGHDSHLYTAELLHEQGIRP